VAFQLKPDRSLWKNLHRVVKKPIEDAIEELDRSHRASRDELVHETRKTMKKVRACYGWCAPTLAMRNIARQTRNCAMQPDH